jgi:hypothetical protein
LRPLGVVERRLYCTLYRCYCQFIYFQIVQ